MPKTISLENLSVYTEEVKSKLAGKQNTLTFDTVPTVGSSNPITSGGVANALLNIDIDVDDHLSSTSINPVQNKIVKSAIDSTGHTISTSYSNSTLTVQLKDVDNHVISTATATITGFVPEYTVGSQSWDTTPSENSTKSVTSGGVYSALSTKQDTLVSGTSIKTINDTTLLGSGNLVLPKNISVSNIASLTTAQVESLNAGDTVEVATGSVVFQTYVAVFKNTTELRLIYVDNDDGEEVYYSKSGSTWSYNKTEEIHFGEQTVDTWREIKVDGTTFLNTSNGGNPLDLVGGAHIALTTSPSFPGKVTMGLDSSTATNGDVLVANGSGSSSWIKLTSDFVNDSNQSNRFVTTEMYNYLDGLLYAAPTISTLTLYDGASEISTTQETGTTHSITAIYHAETNVSNIASEYLTSNLVIRVYPSPGTQQDVEFDPFADDITPSENPTSYSVHQQIISNVEIRSLSLSGTDTRGNTFSKTITINYYDYAYVTTSQSSTTPTSGLSKRSTISSFESSGTSVSYSSGDYIYFYTTRDNGHIYQNIMGQWVLIQSGEQLADATIAKANGTTATYHVYRLGTMSASGTDTFRISA